MFAPPSHSAVALPPPTTMVFTAPMLSDLPSPTTGSSSGGGVRLLVQSPNEGRFNVLVISGFAWHVSEQAIREYLTRLYPRVTPTTVRLYTNPQNGVSRGRCFVEYAHLASHSGGGGSHSAHNHGGGGGAMASSAPNGMRAAVPPFMSGVSAGLTPPLLTAGAETPSAVMRLEDLQQLIESTPYEGTALEVALYYLTATRWDREGKLPDLPSTVPLPARRMVMGYGCEGFVVRCGPQLGLPNTVTPEGAVQIRKLRKRWRAKQRKMESGLRM